jgi:hypothetical protein
MIGKIDMIAKIKCVGKQFWDCLKRYIYQMLYVIMLGVLWTYIVLNWEKCVSMQFFSQFDGNNILFLAGILLIILPFYEVEGNGIKIRKAGTKELEKDLKKEESDFQKSVIQNTMILMQSQDMQCQTEVTENNELSK